MQTQIASNSNVENETTAIPHESKCEKKQPIWLSGKSKIDNPVHIGENFRKIPRDEIYER